MDVARSVWLRVLVAVLALAAAGPVRADEFATIVPAALSQRLEAGDAELLVLDVRTAAEFAEGHLPGAINIPHDAVGDRLAELGTPGARDLVIYCRSGRRTALAMATLQQAGFQRLFHLEGDYLRWSEEGRPLVRASAPP